MRLWGCPAWSGSASWGYWRGSSLQDGTGRGGAVGRAGGQFDWGRLPRALAHGGPVAKGSAAACAAADDTVACITREFTVYGLLPCRQLCGDPADQQQPGPPRLPVTVGIRHRRFSNVGCIQCCLHPLVQLGGVTFRSPQALMASTAGQNACNKVNSPTMEQGVAEGAGARCSIRKLPLQGAAHPATA